MIGCDVIKGVVRLLDPLLVADTHSDPLAYLLLYKELHFKRGR